MISYRDKLRTVWYIFLHTFQVTNDIMPQNLKWRCRKRSPAVRAAVLLALAAIAPAPGQQWIDYDVRPWNRLPHRTLSRPGQDLLDRLRGRWIHGRNGPVTVHAVSMAALDDVIREAAFTYAYVGRELALPQDGEFLHVFVVEDPALWKDWGAQYAWREDGLALLKGHEIYLLRAAAAERRIDIAHEMVHFLLRAHGFGRLPLWLEEGLAMHLGSRAAAAYSARRDRELVRRFPPLDRSSVIPVDELTRMHTYPRDPALMPAFYRQSEILVRLVLRYTGRASLRDLLNAFNGNNAAWNHVLQRRFGLSGQDTESIKKSVLSLPDNMLNE